MDEYFTHKCVTSDAPSQCSSDVSTWSQSARCEFVVVQENQGAHGASRAVLASIVNMVRWLVRLALIGIVRTLWLIHAIALYGADAAVEEDERRAALHAADRLWLYDIVQDSAVLVDTIQPSEKLAHVDYSSDTSFFYASMLQSESPDAINNDKQLLTRLQEDVKDKLLGACAKRSSRQHHLGESSSARPVIVVLDSLNVLLEQYPLQRVLLFLRALHQSPQIGSVIVRFNAATEPKATRQVLTSNATAVALVETPSSLSAYPILAKERRREIPKEMHGFVLLLRQKKNGRSSESVDYFQIDGNRMLFFTAAQAEKKKKKQTSEDEASKNKVAGSTSNAESQSSAKSQGLNSHTSSSSVSAPAGSSSNSHQAALPVRQEEVSFNLSISVEEQLAKSRVQLPYMHQGQSSSFSSLSTTQFGSTTSIGTGNSTTNNLFFIDDDDPDWDDDDLDDDLDI